MGDVRLVLVGGDAGEPGYARRLRSRIDAINAKEARGGSPAIVLRGAQPPETIARLLNEADLFLLASRSEGWCNAIAESLACGCPVVATDVGGNREIVRDDSLGRLVPLGDNDALEGAICEALAGTWDRDRIARVGGGRDWEQVARECVDAFAAVLKRGGRKDA